MNKLMGKQDCVIIPFEGFKEKIRVQKQLDSEMIKKYGKNRYTLSILDNCVMAVCPSNTIYF